ncbi:hypothetical protein BDF21DRAFT_348489 [Thamnidium elegans]|nr:hypothetical protein BDF21DRAFT_348272 [Thamnidium elegans]KAI8059809.1 hypothetical protein BDF21DRAFT_348489 [Thamnidium elegans]
MEWKDADLDYDINGVFIDEARFNINIKNNWARSTIGTPAIVEVEKTRSPSHTIFGAIHPSSIIHFTMKKPLSTRENDGRESNKPPSKGTTTAHFIKFMNKMLDIMNMDDLSQRIADACNNVRFSNLRGFCSQSKRHISNCRDKVES